MNIVLDSSILIDYFRGGIKWENFLKHLEKEVSFFLPSIVIFELFSGKSTQNPRKAEEILTFIKKFQQVDLNAKIARRAGELYRDVKKTLDIPDYIIAACTLEVDGTILTLNKKHFEQIPTLRIYPL